MRVSDLRPRERASEPSHNVLASTSLPQREFMEATFKTTWEKSIKFNALLARPKRFELLTPRFVVWCSIQLSYGRVLRIAREVFPTEPIRRERTSSYRLRPVMASSPRTEDAGRFRLRAHLHC